MIRRFGDGAIQLLRGLIEHVSICPVKDGLEIEIVGEIVKMVELGTGTHMRQAPLDETAARSVKVVAGTRYQRYLHLDLAIL